MAAPRAIAGGIYYLSGVLVKAETKEVAKKLIAKGFRTATDGIKNSGLKVQTVTNSNFVTYVTRALKKAMEQSQKIRQGPKIDPKTGRPVGRGEGTNKLGGSGQSAAGRKLGSMRMKNYGKVRGGKGRAEAMAKPVSARPGNYRTGRQDKVNPATGTIAGLVAAGAIDNVTYEAYIEEYNPTVTQIKAAEKQIAATAKTEKRNLENRRGFKPETKKITRKEPVRPKLRPKVVEAEPMSLRSYLNAEIKSRKSTVTKEKAKAKKGDYKSIAEAKKAKSLYYIKDGKPMAAVYKRDLKGL